MPSRDHYGDTLQLRADLWRVPFTAKGDPAVIIRLLQTFTRLGEQVDDSRFREALWQQVDAVWEDVSAATFVKADRTDIEVAYRRACEALGPR